MKQGKQLTIGKRIIRNVLLLLAMGLAGVISGYTFAVYEDSGFDIGTIFNAANFQIFLRIVVVLLFLTFLLLVYRARKSHSFYQAIDEKEDEQLETVYKQMFRNLEYATIVFNVLSVFSILLVIMSMAVIFNQDSAIMNIQFLDYFLTLGIVISGQTLIFKTTQLIREYKLSAFPTINEVKDYVYSLDEGEQQANFEQAFLTNFNINQRVIPILYVSVFVLDIVLQERQFVAYLVLAIIHIYINVMNAKMVRKYFK